MNNETHAILGGKVHLYRRGDGDNWHCSTFLKGKKHRKTTKSDSLSLAKEVAEDWYLALRGKDRAGLIKSDRTFMKAADQFIKEYGSSPRANAANVGLKIIRSVCGFISSPSSVTRSLPR